MRGTVHVAIDVELDDDAGGADGGDRGELGDAGGFADAAFQRGGDGVCHGFRVRRRDGRRRPRLGRAETGRKREPTSPGRRTPSRKVATGRAMKGAEKVVAGVVPCHRRYRRAPGWTCQARSPGVAKPRKYRPAIGTSLRIKIFRLFAVLSGWQRPSLVSSRRQPIWSCFFVRLKGAVSSSRPEDPWAPGTAPVKDGPGPLLGPPRSRGAKRP